MSPEVTVLTAVRNGARLLPETVSSVRAQTFSDWEYVIVDDASDDETPAVLEELSRTDQRIRIVRRSERGGPYAAANEGLRASAGRYVVRIDADDLAEPNRIERQLDYLKQTGFRACGSFWQRLLDDNSVIPTAVRDASSPRVLKWWYCAGQVVAHSTACVEREAFEAIGCYRELPASQDLRMWCEFARRDWLGIVPEVLVTVRRPGVITSSNSDLQEQLAVAVLVDHLNDMSPEPWTEQEVRSLRAVWSGQKLSIRLHALERWVRLWRSDDALSAQDTRELGRLGRAVRWRMTRQALRREGVSAATLRQLFSPSTLLGAGSR